MISLECILCEMILLNERNRPSYGGVLPPALYVEKFPFLLNGSLVMIVRGLPIGRHAFDFCLLDGSGGTLFAAREALIVAEISVASSYIMRNVAIPVVEEMTLQAAMVCAKGAAQVDLVHLHQVPQRFSTDLVN